MASPVKKMKEGEDTVEGFIFSVSPRKQTKTNSSYFTAVIQCDRKEYHRVVVFAMDKQATFSQAEKNGTAVRLRNVKRSISFSDPDGFDIMCTRRLSVEATQVPFLGSAPPSSTRMSIAEVKALGPRQKVGEIRGKVRMHGAVSKVVMSQNQECELKEVKIFDETGTIQVTLWDRYVDKTEGGRSYSFKDLLTRAGDGGIYVCTGPSSAVDLIADLDLVDEEDGQEQQGTALFRATIKGIEVSTQRKCPSCQVRQKEFVEKSKTHRCEACRLKQTSLSFCPSFGGKAMISSEKGEERVALTNSALCSYLRDARLTSLYNDTEAIEDHFLEVAVFDISVSVDGFLVSIKPATTESEAGPSVAAATADSFSDEIWGSEESIVASSFAGLDSA